MKKIILYRVKMEENVAILTCFTMDFYQKNWETLMKAFF